MKFYADLHVHSKHSRATSRDCDLEHLALWARRKGLTVVATGDFTHPAWWEEIRDKLVPAEPGLFRLRPELERAIDERLPAVCRGRPVRFLLEVEISTIYKAGERTRKVHHLIYAPDLETAGRFRDRLERIGNIRSDGRPILGLDSRHLLEIALESGPGAYLVPAHVWTPWFAVLGSKSGFDSVEECYGDLAGHIFAVETGLSSDPPMNWRLSALDRFTLVSNSDAHSPPMLGREACAFDTELDYFAIRQALESGEGYSGTVEFFPEEGKYHLDGHRACGVRLEPDETRRRDGRCPACGKPVTVGVLHRVEELADRPPGACPERPMTFRSLVPLPEIVAEIEGKGRRTKTVTRRVDEIVARLGPELAILEELPLEEVRRARDPLFSEAVERLRRGKVRSEGGYDGEYGTVCLFEPGELAARTMTPTLFDADWAAAAADAEEAPSPIPAAAAAAAPDTPPVEGGERIRAIPATASSSPRPPAPAPKGSKFLTALDPDQRAAAEVVSGPLLVVAGPGTGKTRTLTHRLAHLVTEVGIVPEACLAVTFTRRAADEMRERLEVLVSHVASRIPVVTFHGLGLEIVRRERVELGLEHGFRIADESERRELVGELFALPRRRAEKLAGELSRAKRARALAVASSKGGISATSAEDEPRAARLCLYDQALRRRGLVDFDDLLVLPVELLGRQGELAAAWRSRYRYLSIDEYQDVDELQYRLVRLLASSAGDVCVIGDPDQSIYRFRGAEVGFFLRFERDFPGARVVELRRNYRSSPTIVRAALEAVAPSSLVPERRLEAVSETADAPIVLHVAPSERAEAEHVVRTIEELIGGTSYFSLDSGRVEDDGEPELGFDDVAVLYRTDAQSEVLIEAFERSGIPYQKRSHERLADRPGVRRLLAGMRAIETAGEGVSVRALLAAAAEAARPSSTDGAEIDVAEDLLEPLADERGDDFEGFCAAIALGAEVDAWDPRAERVSLLTLHAAKGLEFPVVFVVGCCDGLLPLRFGGGEIDEAEERRLFFVGMTRARRRLVLSYPEHRRWRGRAVEVAPSPFLGDLDPARLERRCSPRRPPRAAVPEQLRLL